MLGAGDGADVLPADVYRRLAATSAPTATVVADLSGDYLDAVLEGGVDVLKVSDEEVLRDGLATRDHPARSRRMHAARDEGAGSVMLSRADHPALVLDRRRVCGGRARARARRPRGAGDSMTAGVAAMLARGGTLDDAVRTGAAAGALNVTRHGLGTGGADQIERLAERVRIEQPAASRRRQP